MLIGILKQIDYKPVKANKLEQQIKQKENV